MLDVRLQRAGLRSVVLVWEDPTHPAAHVNKPHASCVACTHVAVHVQVVLYHRHACEAVDEDSLLELADWAVRKLTYLNSGAHRAAAAKGEDSCSPCTPGPV